MKSLIAILTYRRLPALQAMLAGIEEHCPQYQTAVFEDCGNRDATSQVLTFGRTASPKPELQATLYTPEDGVDVHYPCVDVYMGDTNLGVMGNSNRALKVFMDGDWDHLCLCNDDLFVTGDFVKAYANAHQDLGVEMFCFCDFDKASPAISGPPESYKWVSYPWRGYTLKIMPRFTGIMISVARKLIEKIGYFDGEFSKFGEEHCDFTIRARLAGGIRLDKQDMNCLDIEHKCLAHQDVATSMTGVARQRAEQEASVVMRRASYEYRHRHYYRPFSLGFPATANGYYGVGMPCRHLANIGYKLCTGAV